MIEPYYMSDSAVIYHGDCLEMDEFMLATSVDMVLTDLPYGTTDCKWDKTLDLRRLWKLWDQITRARSAIVLTASQPFTSQLVMSRPDWFKHEWIWEKNAGSNFGTVRYQPMKEHESVLVFGHGLVRYFPIMQERTGGGLARVQSGPVNYATKAEVYQSGGLMGTASSNRPDLRYPRSIQRFNRERGLHPTQKPVGLMAYMIETYTEGGDTVLDCCMGSGSTLVAAQRTGRFSIGIEIDERYCEVAATRLSGEVTTNDTTDV